MPNWTKEQEEAINTSGTNIIVSAGAGSGKTAVLTERVLTKIKQGININELLILTFTNAAAHEMKDRIRRTLKKEGFVDQLEYIDEAYITTFDSFALSIVKKYHYLFNIPKNVSIIDGTFISNKIESILDKIFEDLYKNRDKYFISLIESFCVKDDKQIRECILTIYAKLKQMANMKDYLSNYIDNYYSDEYIKKIFADYEKLVFDKIDILKDYLSDIKYEVDGDYYTKLADLLNPLFRVENFNDIVSYIPERLPVLKNSTELGKEIKSQISSVLKEVKELTELDKGSLILNYKHTENFVKVIAEIILKLDDDVKSYKKSINYYEFSDIALMAIEILENNEDIRLELKNTYKEIMIDEYQDTNDLQEYFISLIENNNVYMVGDIKQSIYRFRNANPNLFKTKYDNYMNLNGGIKIDLNKNFRSRKEILNDINVIFDLIMDNKIGGADYKATHRMVFGNSLYDTLGNTQQVNDLEILNYEYDKKSAFSRDEYEAFIVADDIKNKIENKYLIFDKDTQEIRPCTYADFVILMDRTTSFETFRKVLDYYEIPTSVFKDENIINEEEIGILKNYIRLILKIYDRSFDQVFRYCFTSVARSYLYKMSDKEIYEIFSNNSFYDTLLFNDAKSLAQDVDLVGATDLLERILDKCDFDQKILSTNEVINKGNIIHYLKNIIKDMNLMGLSILEICDYLDEIIDNLKEIKVSKKVDNADAVKIMTIFKSKGLEFSICYQTLLTKQFNIRELNSLFFYDDKLGIVPTLFDDGITDTFLKVLAKNNYMKENISERIRLFYVSLTRCKEKMIILADLNKKDKRFVDELVSDDERLNYKSFNDIIVSVKENLQKYIKNVNLDELNISLDYRLVKDKDLKSIKGNKIVLKPLEIECELVNKKHFSKETYDLITIDNYENMKFGTFMHEIMEIVDFKKPNIDELNIDDYYKRAVRNLLKNDIFKNLDKTKIYKEYEFIYKKDKTNYHGIIDLMIVRDNYVDIVDYKLKNIDDEKYIEQLNGYKNFINDYLGKPVNLYLYSILEEKFKKL